MRNEVQNDATAAYREVTGTASPVPPPSQPASGQSEQASDRYVVTPDKEQYIRKVMQIAADEKASNVPDVDERMMRLRERVALEEKEAHESRKAAAGARSPLHRAREIMSGWGRDEITGWYDKQREILNDHFARSISELRLGPKSYDQQKAELQQAYAEAGVAGKPPRLSAEEVRTRFQHALQIARAELSGQE